MSNEDAKNALKSRCPVIYNDIIYKCISAIIYRKSPKGRIVLSLELTDRTAAHSVTIAPANRVQKYVKEC